MRHRYLSIVALFLCALQAVAGDFTTLVHHKDGRVFAIATNRIDSITHTADEIDVSYYDLTDSFVFPPHISAIQHIIQLADSGIPGLQLVTPEIMEALFASNARLDRPGESLTQPAIFTLIDDDVIDEYIPSSHPGQSIKNSNEKVGGYFSLLYPMIRSLEEKHHISLSCGLAVEGHRIGLTNFWSESDECVINENGQLIQQLMAHTNWDCLCHSMTARLAPDSSTFIVDSLSSEEALEILAHGVWKGFYSIYTAGVYDRQTKKNYTISGDRNKWVETPKKYIQPYCFDLKNGKWIYNESFPVDYQLGEWKRRASLLGFNYADIVVFWGNTASGTLINHSHPYFSHYMGHDMNDGINTMPLSTSAHRTSTIKGKDNAFNAELYETLRKAIDNTLASQGWLILKSHAYLINYYNGYLDNVSYPEKDEHYHPEWIHPLNTEEIQSMDENNYWENPPARLGISNWGEWYPAKGTQLWGLYRVLEYAIEQGLQNVTPSEGFRRFGNKVNIGVYRDIRPFNREQLMQLTARDSCYLVVGADGSIKYESHK